MVRPYGLMRAKGAALSKHSQRSRALVDAYCDWSDGEEVYRLYLAAHVMTAYFGQKYVVDHIVPLQSLLVCGLHTHTNLRVDLADDNRLKGNVFWPDMWDANWETLVFVLESR